VNQKVLDEREAAAKLPDHTEAVMKNDIAFIELELKQLLKVRDAIQGQFKSRMEGIVGTKDLVTTQLTLLVWPLIPSWTRKA